MNPMTPAARAYLAELEAAALGTEGLPELLALVEAQSMPPPSLLAQAMHRVMANRTAIVAPPGAWEVMATQVLGLIQVWRLQALAREQAVSPQVVDTVENPGGNGVAGD